MVGGGTNSGVVVGVLREVVGSSVSAVEVLIPVVETAGGVVFAGAIGGRGTGVQTWFHIAYTTGST